MYTALLSLSFFGNFRLLALDDFLWRLSFELIGKYERLLIGALHACSNRAAGYLMLYVFFHSPLLIVKLQGRISLMIHRRNTNAVYSIATILSIDVVVLRYEKPAHKDSYGG